MAALEEEGYIAQPHTSAGRVPTDKGYRLFVDRLSQVKPLSGAERRAIETFLDGAVDLDDVVGRTVRLLAQLTRQVAVVQYPSLTRSTVRHVELVPLAERRLMLVLITNTGRVEQRVVDCPRRSPRTPHRAPAGAAQQPAWTAAGSRDVPDAGGRPARAAAGRGPARRGHGAVGPAGDAGRAARGADRDRRHGQPRRAPTSRTSLRDVLEALEEQVVLMRLLGETDRLRPR